MEYAQILCTRHWLLLGRWFTTYEWQGSERLPVIVQRQYIREQLEDGFSFPERLDCFPWPLRLIGEDTLTIAWDGAIYARTDSSNNLTWAYNRARSILKSYLNPVYYRLLLTLMVWGLAYIPEYEQPSWKHVGRKKKVRK